MADEKGGEKLALSRESELIKHAGLTPTKIGDILGISRAAVYQRLNKAKDGAPAFNTSELAVIYTAVLGSDSPQADSLYNFIEQNYSPEELALVFPDRITLSQFENAAKKGERVIFGFNGNTDHITGKSLFTKALSTAQKNFPEKLSVVTPVTWFKGYLTDQVGLSVTHPHIVTSEFKSPLSFVLIEKTGLPARAFYFGRYALSEADESSAQELSKHVASLSR